MIHSFIAEFWLLQKGTSFCDAVVDSLRMVNGKARARSGVLQ